MTRTSYIQCNDDDDDDYDYYYYYYDIRFVLDQHA